MPDQMSDSQAKASPFQHTELFRKLNKREQRLLTRLQEAESARAKAAERLDRAETRLRKRTARVQRAKARLEAVRQELRELMIQAREAAPIADAPTSTSTAAEANPSLTGRNQEEGRDEYGRDLSRPAADSAALSPAEAADFAREARAAAEAAENAARKAAERAVEVMERIEQMSGGRHLLQEVSQAQFEAEQANTVAQEAERAAQEAERLAVEAEQLAQEVQQVHEYAGEAPTEDEQQAKIPTDEAAASASAGEAGEDSSEEGSFPRMIVRDDVEEEDEEELQVAEIAAMMIADVAAAAAAESKAIAEASSARTREARQKAAHMDQVVQEVRDAIKRCALTGEEATARLYDVEHNATRAHAMLADAEATEEQAIQSAKNAETEAEIAEGLVFADLAYHDSLREEMRATPAEDAPPSAQSTEAIASAPEQTNAAETNDDESDVTVKIPKTPFQENDVDE